MVGLMTLIACNQQPLILLKSTRLDNFPSGSSIEFYNGKLILVGDDATPLMIVDSDHNRTDSMVVDSSGVARISKDIKPDYEASIILKKNNEAELIAIGSGSTADRENLLHVSLPASRSATFFVQPAKDLYDSIRQLVGKDINIEGAAIVKNKLVFANRAHINQPKNSIIVFDTIAISNPGAGEKFICEIVLPNTGKVVGISGLAYVEASDILWFTASTEETVNTHDDGIIGDSYIGYILHASSELNKKQIPPSSFINLSEMNAAFKQQKIEGVAIEKTGQKEVVAHLIADNDNGTTRLFKVTLNISGN